MSTASDGIAARELYARLGGDLAPGDHPSDGKPEPARDWKKIVLIVGLGLLSWVATYVGMLELVEANMGDLPLIHKVIIGFSVAMLMVMVVWLLDQIFAPIGLWTRLAYVFGYLFLTLISVGFGFGFYWKVLESRSVAATSAEAAVTQVQNALFAASTRLEQLQGTLDQLVTVSKQKAEMERANGTSCPSSRPGDGPRRRLREEDAARFGFAGDFVKTRAGAVKSEMTALDADLLKIVTDDKSIIDAKSGTRNEFMKALGRKLELTVTGFNTFRSDAQLKQIRSDLADRADRQTFADGRGATFVCPDVQLQAALKGVVRAIDELPALEKPKIATVEGSEAVIEAFRRLTATFYGALAFKLPPTAEELRELQRKAMEQVDANGSRTKTQVTAEQAGLSKRDYIPLAIAVFVDLCLLLVSIGRPIDRMQGLLPRMRAAERGPVIQILSRFNQIHRDAEIRENFEIFRHVVFDFNGDYYVAVPLDAPTRMNPDQREELRVETSILANLFASFEHERVFSRVLMPLLPVSMIRRKLRRQGSKFAEAEAFRIYKFRNGAWSEFILGAVMGAARRVEQEKHRRHIESEIFRSEGPELPTASPKAVSPLTATSNDNRPRPAPAPVPEAFATFDGGRHERNRRRADASVATSAAPPSPATAATPANERRFGPYARFVPTEERVDAGGPAEAHAFDDALSPGERRNSDTQAIRGSGADAGHVANVIPLPTASPPSAVANGRSPSIYEDVISPDVAAGTPSAPKVTIEAVERKVTYHMPASELTLPLPLETIRAGHAIDLDERDQLGCVQEAQSQTPQLSVHLPDETNDPRPV